MAAPSSGRDACLLYKGRGSTSSSARGPGEELRWVGHGRVKSLWTPLPLPPFFQFHPHLHCCSLLLGVVALVFSPSPLLISDGARQRGGGEAVGSPAKTDSRRRRPRDSTADRIWPPDQPRRESEAVTGGGRGDATTIAPSPPRPACHSPCKEGERRRERKDVREWIRLLAS